MNNDAVTALGIMSGSSMDGLDLVIVRFRGLIGYLTEGTGIQWNLLRRQTLEYPSEIEELLRDISDGPLTGFLERRTMYDRWLCAQIEEKFTSSKEMIDFISMHGHTLWHKPDKGYSLQIPDGQRLSAISALPVITDFRQGDIALGGEGTPLAPVADRDLFPTYDAWLNIGGIANLTYREHSRFSAYDICPANQLLNHLARKTGVPFDNNGAMARSGQLIPDLLHRLNKLDYYDGRPPKSLDNNFIAATYFPLLNSGEHNTADLLSTTAEHIAEQIHKACQKHSAEGAGILVTGGGAHNGYLLDRLRAISGGSRNYIIPDEEIVDFKECILTAWAGLLRLYGRPNMLSSVTGAGRSSSGGAVYDVHGKLNQWKKIDA